MMKPRVLQLSALSVCVLLSYATAAESLLRPWQENAWYWSYRGQPVLLLGGSDDDNLFQWPEKRLIPQLDRMVTAGANVIRNTMSDRKDKGFEVYPFKLLGNGKYDLNVWEDEYWVRFERLLHETAKRGIFVQIEIWDRFDFTDNSSAHWKIHPYNPCNNVNYSYEESCFSLCYPEHPSANEQPFFFTTPQQRDNRVVLRYQQQFVDKLLDCTLQFEHVLYCVDNETSGEVEWSRYWAQFVKERAARQAMNVYVTEMWDDWDLTSPRHKRTFDNPQLYGFVDVSQNNQNRGQNHWDNFLFVRQYLSCYPRPINTTKTYGATDNKFGHTDQDGIERFWRHLLAGAASIRFHRPNSGLGLNDKAVACLRAARKLESIVPLWSLQPANELLSNRVANEAYLGANRGLSYVVYFPNGGEVDLDVSDTKGPLVAKWVNIESGEFGPQGQLSAGEIITVSPPNKNDWVVAFSVP